MAKIDLVFLDHTRSSRPALRRAAALDIVRATLKNVKLPKAKTVEVAMVLIGKTRMRALNKKWRHRDKATDVLSFPLSEPLYKGYTSLSLGDIFICPMVVREKAALMGLTERAQMAWTLVHGLLHLAGHDHPDDSVGTPTLRRRGERMAKLERRILDNLKK